MKPQKFYIRMKKAEAHCEKCQRWMKLWLRLYKSSRKDYRKAREEYSKAEDIWMRHTPKYELEARRKKGKTK
jgi:hypothetical protein